MSNKEKKIIIAREQHYFIMSNFGQHQFLEKSIIYKYEFNSTKLLKNSQISQNYMQNKLSISNSVSTCKYLHFHRKYIQILSWENNFDNSSSSSSWRR